MILLLIMRRPRVDITLPPRKWTKQTQQQSADSLVRELRIQLEHMQLLNRGKAIRISYGGVFGVMRALRVAPKGGDSLLIEVQDDNGVHHNIIAPTTHCSFMLSVFVPTADEREDRFVFGVAEGQSEPTATGLVA